VQTFSRVSQIWTTHATNSFAKTASGPSNGIFAKIIYCISALAAEDNALRNHFAQLWNKSERTLSTLLTEKSTGITGEVRGAMFAPKSPSMIKSGSSIRH
jgi:hypothetical protein